MRDVPDADVTLRVLGARMTDAFRSAVVASGAAANRASLAFVVARHFTCHLPRHVDAMAAVDIEGAGGELLRCDVAIVDAAVSRAAQRSSRARVVNASDVLGVVEVRPVLDRDQLLDALRTIAASKRICGAAYSVVIGLECAGLAALHDDVDDDARRTVPSDRADLVCALDAGVLAHSTGFTAVSTHEPLLATTLFLQNALFDVSRPSRAPVGRNVVAMTRSLDLLV